MCSMWKDQQKMKKIVLVKKLVLSAFVILYDIVSLLLCYVFIKSLIFELSTVKIGLNGIEVVGGVDLSTLIYKMGNVIGVVFPILFILLSVATVFLLTVSIFKKQINRKFNILLCIFSALTLVIFMLIPPQTYVISLYILVRKLSFLKYIRFIYIIVSLIIIVTNILFAIKRNDKTQ